MQNKLFSFLFSTRLTAFLFIAFAVAMGIGTFLDASAETSPTAYSRSLIYNAWWFELLMLLFVINFIGNIKRYRLLRKVKWATLLLHVSFILIIIGAFVTRYIGYEGVIHIREGATENTLLSEHTYLSVFIDGDYKVNGVPQRRVLKPKKLRLSERLNNAFTIATDYNTQAVTIKYKQFIENAIEGVIPNSNGTRYLKLVEASDNTRHEHWLQEGEVANIHNVLFAFNAPTQGAININYDSDTETYTLNTVFSGNYMRMADQQQGTVLADSTQTLQFRSLYQMAGTAFVFPEPSIIGQKGLVKAPENTPATQDGLILEITSNNQTKTLSLLGGKGSAPNPKNVEVGGLTVYASYSSKEIELPFSITLNDFIAEKYPGTENSYSAFESKVTVNNPDGSYFDYDIYMNHVLDHSGFRFFQASFDLDEKGTILSVNHDFWGTWITYIGYFLLYFGLMAILFDKNTRFGSLKRMLNKLPKNKVAKGLIVALLLLSQNVFSQESHSPINNLGWNAAQIDSIIQSNAVSKAHAAKFAELVIQDNGRMKPIHTFASELLRKVSKKNNYKGLDANQVFLSITEFPRLWTEVPIIALKRGNDSIRQIIGVPKNTKHVTLLDLFDSQVNYKLDPYLQTATSKTNPNQFEKDFIKAHENYYLLNQALGGGILKLFPLPNNPNNKWVSYPELSDHKFTERDSIVVNTVLPLYFQALREARQTQDYTQAEQVLGIIAEYQTKYGAEVMPSTKKIKAEILYNKIDLFNKLYKYLMLFGILMFLALIVQIFKVTKSISVFIKVTKIIIWSFFIAATLGLILRAYVSGHAPWSDAYESIVYVGWATLFFGLSFGRKSDLTVAATAFVSAIVLWVAHQNWLDPAIANLQPVLDSYWLMIHVAVIVASYGPFTLGLILGASSLLLILLTTRKNKPQIDLKIKELTIICEMALTVGLILLTIGNFLGGQWANESWGRYWGWDPKETWALISIMVYAFVIHARLVPGLRGRWFFNTISIFAYAAIMMTYFGVNFYLTGLHSYASGDVPVTPRFVWYIIAFFIALSTAAYFKEQSLKKYN